MKPALALACVLVATPILAQSHPCDVPPPVSGSAVAGTTVGLAFCHSGLDGQGQPLASFAVYDNNTRAPLAVVKGGTPNSAGLFEYAGSYTVPNLVGARELQAVAVDSAARESARSNTFALTVTAPPQPPPAPQKFRLVIEGVMTVTPIP